MVINNSIIKQIKKQLTKLNKNIVQYNKNFNSDYPKITIDMLKNYNLLEKFAISYINNHNAMPSFRKIRFHKGYVIDNIFAGTKDELVEFLKKQKTKECSICKKNKIKDQ